MSSAPLVIVGASVRAAAWSAQRAGYRVWGADLFADRDTGAWAQVHAVPDYPAGLGRVLAAAPPGPWMYTGGIENYPDLVAEWSTTRSVWGVSAGSLRRARDPDAWAAALVAEGLPVPRWQSSPRGLSLDGSWLAKRLRGSGGLGVEPWRGQSLAGVDGGWFFQERIVGRPCAALFVAGPSRTRLWGLTAQLADAAWTGARPFQYAGSIGPLPVAPDFAAELARLGAALAGALELRGVFGVDGLIQDERFWPVEINPRYPASLELIERATGENAIDDHATACQGVDPQVVEPQAECLWGKAILYAPRAFHVDDALADEWAAGALAVDPPCYADVPPAGTTIEAGWPICTLLARGSTIDGVRGELKARALRVLAQLASN